LHDVTDLSNYNFDVAFRQTASHLEHFAPLDVLHGEADLGPECKGLDQFYREGVVDRLQDLGFFLDGGQL